MKDIKEEIEKENMVKEKERKESKEREEREEKREKREKREKNLYTSKFLVLRFFQILKKFTVKKNVKKMLFYLINLLSFFKIIIF